MRAEILAPIASLEKAQVAFAHGADAVYIGATMFSLRKRASQISLDELHAIIKYAHNLKKKVYVTTNIIPDLTHFKTAKKVFKELIKIGVDAFICSSLAFIKILRKMHAEVHLSTQQSVTNSYALAYYKNLGVKRVVLARELTLTEIKELNASNVELEVFIHGGVCNSYSGRCNLSYYLASRNANAGDCAHSCRWMYHLYQHGEKISDKIFSLSHADLQSIETISELVKIPDVVSLKIEGRMKTINYIATITNIYHQLLNGQVKYDVANELQTAGGRKYSSGALSEIFDQKAILYDFTPTTANQNFLGVVDTYNPETGLCRIIQKNHFTPNSEVYFLTPNEVTPKLKLGVLYDTSNIQIEAACHPEQVVLTTLPPHLKIEKGSLMKR